MEVLLELATVAGLGIVELWAAVPAGVGLGLHPAATAATAAAGAIVGVLAVTLLGASLRERLLRNRPLHGHERTRRIWRRYGLAGVGLLAPLLVGAWLGAALALALGAPPRRLLIWSSLGVIFWSTVLTAAAELGLTSLEHLV